jgi:hypothetical protein
MLFPDPTEWVNSKQHAALEDRNPTGKAHFNIGKENYISQ